MKLTTFLSLKKPDYTDSADVQDFNDNMDAIDKKLQDMSTATGDLSNGKIFTAKATDRADINSGETIGTIIGKVMKWFADLKPAAFADIADNDNTTASGYVASASVVKQHGDEIDKANKELGGLYFGKNSSGQYGYATTDGGDIHPFRNPTGNVSAGEVLAGKVFSSASVENGVGTMPNRGTLNWTPGNGTTASVAAGYYSGGTLDSRTAYNQGVSDADGRTNTSSANYKAGYNSGYSNGQNSVRTGGGKDRGGNWKDGRADMASESIWIPRCVAAVVEMKGTGNGDYPPAIFLSSGYVVSQRSYGDEDCTVFVVANCTSAQTATLRGAYHGDPVYFLTTIGEY